MRDLTFGTVVLGSAMVMMTISVGMMSWTMFRMSGDSTNTASVFFGNMRMFVVTPTVMNALSLALLGVLMLMG